MKDIIHVLCCAKVFDHVLVEVGNIPIRGVAALGASEGYCSYNIRSYTEKSQLCEVVCGLRRWVRFLGDRRIWVGGLVRDVFSG